MRILNQKLSFFLALGDLFLFSISLALTLFIRYGVNVSSVVISRHIIPFAVLFILWVVVFLIAGLYEHRSIIFRRELLSLVLGAQAVNAIIAVLFFYFIPLAQIAPKTNLFIYLFISSGFIILWRTRGISSTNSTETVLLLAQGSDADELKKEIESKKGYGMKIVSIPDAMENIPSDISPSVIVFDPHAENNINKIIYKFIFSHIRIVDITTVYENIFGRIPLRTMNERWILENISAHPKAIYDFTKRAMDICISTILGCISIPLYPIVMPLIMISSRGPAFIFQKRIGKDGKIITIPKFRTMKVNDGGKWITDGDTRITKVGQFLRKTRIDELPQLFSIIKGDLSLIGPRPDIYDLGKHLDEQIPYYQIRNIIKPGLSGWAQIEQQNPPQSVDETKMRLAYDLYYIKNRSLALDLKIAFRTIKTLLARAGR